MKANQKTDWVPKWKQSINRRVIHIKGSWNIIEKVEHEFPGPKHNPSITQHERVIIQRKLKEEIEDAR